MCFQDHSLSDTAKASSPRFYASKCYEPRRAVTMGELGRHIPSLVHVLPR